MQSAALKDGVSSETHEGEALGRGYRLNVSRVTVRTHYIVREGGKRKGKLWLSYEEKTKESGKMLLTAHKRMIEGCTRVQPVFMCSMPSWNRFFGFYQGSIRFFSGDAAQHHSCLLADPLQCSSYASGFPTALPRHGIRAASANHPYGLRTRRDFGGELGGVGPQYE